MQQSHRPLTVAAILLSMFMAAMEGTVVATAMPTLVAELHGLELYGWVGATYMLASTVTIPLWGKLSDMRGRKPVMLQGLVIFLVASVACGMSTSMEMLIIARGLQGIGAGALQPIAMTMVGDLFTVQERSRIQGMFGAVWGFAAMVGPLIGGFLVRYLSWRWIFHINIPIGLLSGALLVAFYRDPPATTRPGALDVPGAVLMMMGVLSLLLGVGGWIPAISLPASGLLLLAFVWVEARAQEPILPLSMFTIRSMASATACNLLTGCVMMGVLMYTPLYVQAVLQTTPTAAGASIAPMLLAWPIASALGGRVLPRFGYRPLVRIGLTVVSIATVALWWEVRRSPSLAGIQVAMFALGLGMGFANIALLIAVQESVDFRRRGVATATTMFFRNVGGTVATGALGVLVAHAVRDEISAPLLAELLGPTHGKLLAPDVLARSAGAMQQGMLPVFASVAVMGVLVLISGWTFPHVGLDMSRPRASHPTKRDR